MTTVAQALRKNAANLTASATPRLDCEVLLAHTLAVDRSELYRAPERPLDDDQLLNFERLTESRQGGKPIAQLVGCTEFFSLDFVVSNDVLVPRPETEILVEFAITETQRIRAPQIADLGTGSGIIATCVALSSSGARIIAIDESAAALSVARKNFERHGVLDRVHAIRGDWFESLAPATFDLIVSNPPYIAANDPLLSTTDIRFEPRGALVGGSDGLAALRTISGGAAAHLTANGVLAFEHGYNQGQAVRDLLHQHGYVDITTKSDLAGHERVTYGRRREGVAKK